MRPGVGVVLLHVLGVQPLVDGEREVEDDDRRDEVVDGGDVEQDVVGEHLHPPDEAQHRQGNEGGELKRRIGVIGYSIVCQIISLRLLLEEGI